MSPLSRSLLSLGDLLRVRDLSRGLSTRLVSLPLPALTIMLLWVSRTSRSGRRLTGDDTRSRTDAPDGRAPRRRLMPAPARSLKYGESMCKYGDIER